MAGQGRLDAQVVDALADHGDRILGAVEEAQAADEARYLARYAAVG